MRVEQKFKVLMFTCVALGLCSIFTGISFSVFSANLKGNNVNEISTSKITFVYDEIKSAEVSAIATDQYGISSTDYIEFTSSVSSTGKAKLEYYIYLEPHEDNTLPQDKIKIYLTDEYDVPISDEFKDLENGIGKLCYDYSNNIYYTKEDIEFSNCLTHNIELNSSKYIMKSKYINKVSEASSSICKKYTNINGEIKEEDAELSNCKYGDVYNAKANLVSFNNDKNYIEGITNIIYKGIYEFDNNTELNTKTYRLRYWSNDVDVETTESTTEETHTVETNPLSYKFNVNIFSRQVELGS